MKTRTLWRLESELENVVGSARESCRSTVMAGRKRDVEERRKGEGGRGNERGQEGHERGRA